MQTISWSFFLRGYEEIKSECNSYRLGQHFINMFIEDDSGEVLIGLWYKTGGEAFIQICDVIDHYQWSLNELPLIQNRGDYYVVPS